MVHINVADRASGEGSVAGGPQEELQVAVVPQELELLKGINAFATPGNLLALMGGSGRLYRDLVGCAMQVCPQTL